MRAPRTLPLIFGLFLALSCRSALAQVEIATWSIATDHPAHLGQASPGNVVASENDVNSVLVLGATPGGFVLGIGPNSRFAVQTTDDSIVVVAPGDITIRKFSLNGLLQRQVTYPIPLPFGIGRLVPLVDGQVLARFPGGYQVLDRFLAPVGGPVTPAYGGALGFARRPDGSIVACEVDALLVPHLVAYAPDWSVLWNVPIATGGPVACTAEGGIYVAHGPNATSLDLYRPNGSFFSSWSGPPGAPLVNIVDITSSRSGDVLYTLTFARGGPVRVFGSLPSAAQRTTWGAVKALFR